MSIRRAIVNYGEHETESFNEEAGQTRRARTAKRKLAEGEQVKYMECQFCEENINRVDYKNTQFLRKYVTSQFKIATSRRNQLCNKHQRRVAEAVKLARFMAIMPYTRNQTVK